MRKTLIAALIAAVLSIAPRAARAETVDLVLVLAADVSRSVDEDEFDLQRKGYAAAFTDPRVLAAIHSGTHHAIAVMLIEWSGAESQRVIAGWTVIRDEESGSVFAGMVRAAPRSFAGFTSISAALDFSMKQFADSGVTTDRRIIDVSGDGTNNGGPPVTDARDAAVAAGVTINGLAIINPHPNPGFSAHTQPPGGIGAYYRQNVAGGPGNFVLVIKDFSSFADAIVQKLVAEIATADALQRMALR